MYVCTSDRVHIKELLQVGDKSRDVFTCSSYVHTAAGGGGRKHQKVPSHSN